MRKINFTKMVASGNDFVIIPLSPACPAGRRYPVIPLKKLAQSVCNRKYGIGADGLLVLEKSKIADVKMRIFNADGSEAEMCGNGARCVAFWLSAIRNTQYAILKIETKAGIIESQANGNNVKIKLTDPKDIKLDIPIKINNRLSRRPDFTSGVGIPSQGTPGLSLSGTPLKVNFINTGVPHTVTFVEGLPRSFFLHSVSSKQKGRGLDKIDVVNLGKLIRYHKRFAPAGSNVDFMEVLSNNSIKIRTYERGVEDETLACGTGSVASALLYAIRYTLYATSTINVHTKSGEVLKVYFDRVGNGFKNVWLEGKAKIVYKGVYYVK